MIAKIVIVAVVMGAITLLYALRNIGTISGAEARARVSAGATLVDVRALAEFSEGHWA